MADYCTHCGDKLEFGAVRYVVTIHVAAESDGVLPAAGAQEDLEAFMRSVDNKIREDSEEVEKDLHQSKAFVLCTGCKNDFMNNVSRPIERPSGPDDPGKGPDSEPSSGEGQVH